MKVIELTSEEAIQVLQKSKGKKVLVAIQDLEAEEEISAFLPIMKNDCEGMIRDAETLISATNDFVKQLRLFTEKQSDLQNIRAVGYQKIILLKWKTEQMFDKNGWQTRTSVLI